MGIKNYVFPHNAHNVVRHNNKNTHTWQCIFIGSASPYFNTLCVANTHTYTHMVLLRLVNRNIPSQLADVVGPADRLEHTFYDYAWKALFCFFLFILLWMLCKWNFCDSIKCENINRLTVLPWCDIQHGMAATPKLLTWRTLTLIFSLYNKKCGPLG